MKKSLFVSAAAAALFAFPLMGGITLLTPENGSEVSLHNALQKEYLTMPRAERRVKFADPVYRKKMRSAGYVPQPVVLTWKTDGTTKGPFKVLLSESANFRKPEKSTVKENKASFTNLKIATPYYWKVTAFSGESASGQFRTAELAPRLVGVEGVPNVRDLGGRKGLNGKRVKQGMIYRSAGLNNNASPIYEDPEKVMIASPSRKVMADAAKADLVAMKDDKAKMVPWGPGDEWTVFKFPNTKISSAVVVRYTKEFDSIPMELDGTKGMKVKADGKGGLYFDGIDGISERRLAVLMQEFQSAEEGRLAVSCGGDWYWVMIVNGKIVQNCYFGNFNNAYFCNDFSIPVRKGRNQITILLGSGTGGWQFFFTKPASVSVKKLNRNRKIMNMTLLKKITAKIIGRKPGKSRVAGASGDYMRNTLGIRSDIDLRSDGECFGMTGSPLGETVTWFHISSNAYGGMSKESAKIAFAKVFRVFLDPKNYPVDFHCIAGQDRTGAVAFILNGLLGVEEDQLYLDWEATGFWNPSTSFDHKKRFDKLVAVFESLPGKNVTEKCESYVKSCGFTDKDIAKFRSIMLE